MDKTRLIEQLLAQWGEVNLFTRPRRFGKSLNMSMFQHFFEIGNEKSLFDGLDISKNYKLCEEYQGRYPVVSISLKGINGRTYEEARDYLVKTINEEGRRLSFLSESSKLDKTDQELFNQLKMKEMSNDSLVYSIRELTELLEKHYGQKVIVLIDEYDVPLAKANENGYYDEMVLLIRNLFENGLKTNKSLKFAILTGCLRVAKESIFTDYMKKTISIRDTFVQKPTKENFYHGLLLGILGFKENWSVMSNRESGDGFSDILIRIEDEEIGIVIEVKYASDGDLEKECEKALQQIIDVGYTESLEQEGIHKIIKYGIACYKKKCKVVMKIEE